MYYFTLPFSCTQCVWITDEYINASDEKKRILLQSYMDTMRYSTCMSLKWIFTRVWTSRVFSAKTDICGLAVSVLYILNREIWVSFKSWVKKMRICRRVCLKKKGKIRNQSEMRNTNIACYKMNWNGHIWRVYCPKFSDKFGVITPELIPSAQQRIES